MVLLTQDVKKIKGTTHKNDDIDGTCIKVCLHQAKTKNIKEQEKRSKNKRQTSKKMSAFARSEHSLN